MENEVKTTPLEMSVNINELADALSEAQPELESVSKDEKGYGYNYSSLASTITTAKPVLAKFGLAVVQLGATITTAKPVLAKFGLAVVQLVGNDGDRPSVTTILTHKSGQFIRTTASMPLVEMKGVNEAQRAGAVYSYIRRYALQAILNMASEDNDASSNGTEKPKSKTSFSNNKAADKPTKFKRTAKKAENTGAVDEL
jgi:hypothetical protein